MNTTTAVRLLVPIDGSDLAAQAVPFAVRFAGTDAQITLLRVMPPVEQVKGFWGGALVTASEIAELSEAEAVSDLETARELVPEGIEVDTLVVRGDPADQIMQTALRRSVDFIVMASHGRGAVGRWTFGSVADRVARASVLPVVVVRSDRDRSPRPDIGRVVVPLDGSELAARALPVAQRVAARLGTPVNVVEVINPAHALYPGVVMAGPASGEAYDDAVERDHATAETTVQTARRTLADAGIPTASQVLIGAVVPAIEATLHPNDLVVITSHGRGGIKRWLLGSVAERLIHDGLAPVLLVPATERATVVSESVPSALLTVGSAD